MDALAAEAVPPYQPWSPWQGEDCALPNTACPGILYSYGIRMVVLNACSDRVVQTVAATVTRPGRP